MSLNLTDITNSRRFLWDASGTNFDMTMMRRRESRVATLTFAYRFGKITENKKTRQKTNQNDSDNTGGDMGM